MGDGVRADATPEKSALCRARTYDPLIKSQPATSLNIEKNVVSKKGAAPGAADNPKEPQLDGDLSLLMDVWCDLSDAVRIGIMAMVRASRGTGP